MNNQAYQHMLKTISSQAIPLATQNNDFTTLLNQIGDARFVLIGEATHGTQEFYQARIEITQQLIEKKNFMAVAIEGDWPDVYRIHRYLRGQGNINEWNEALSGFKRFPRWMWRNTTLPPFISALRQWNDKLAPRQKIGFYGLDLYSLHASMQAVIDYLTTVDPEGAALAKARYGCFDHLKPDPQLYGYLNSIGKKHPCTKETIAQLLSMQQHALEYATLDDLDANETYFYNTQNARVVKNAEHYYRAMFEDHVSSWNVRDKHMAETLSILADYLEEKFKRPAKIVVWAHNSHIGDARATEAAEDRQLNLGQLVREQQANDAYLIGFSTYEGSVTAASNWDAPAECKRVNPGLESSYEAVFHDIQQNQFLLNLRGDKTLEHYLQLPRLQRAIGVMYRPETERQSHYYFARLPYQFDSLIHFDHTSAVQPLDSNPEWDLEKSTGGNSYENHR